jgi:predicted RNA-binding Zn ribbon-like protein
MALDMRPGKLDPSRFELTGGRPCLDLANTLSSRTSPAPRDLLANYRDFLAWGEQAGLLNREEARRLKARARRRPREAEAALKRAIVLREAVFSVFSAIAGGRVPPAPALEAVNATLPSALGRLRINRRGTTFTWGWSEDTDLDRVLWPVAYSAAELLASPERARVRECAAPGCAWLFLDRSRNRSRRWCDMAVCGNRAKARRHYREWKARTPTRRKA